MLDKLSQIESKYQTLEEQLKDPNNIGDFNRLKELSKEKAKLDDLMTYYQKYKKIISNLEKTKLLLKDSELKEIAAEELISLTTDKDKLEEKIKKLLLPKDEDDGKNVIFEIRGAAGGNEANIFAGDLLAMYLKYITNKGWFYEIIHSVAGESGGYSQVEMIIRGKDVYSKLKYESGSHRVQRIPATESKGRVHTSTATVIVMPEEEDITLDIKESDLKIDVYRSSGAGGQSVNTTDSAVRITHLPTGIMVTCQNERSQLQNKLKALNILKSKLYQAELLKKEQQLSSLKGSLASINFGSQIRSYIMHPYKLVKDHRTNYETNNLEAVLDGDLNPFMEAFLKNQANH